MSTVLQNLGDFLGVALIALFVQNSVLTRGFGVSRLTKLVTDSATDSLIFCTILCLINVLSALPAYFANSLLEAPQIWYRDYLRPLVFILCAALALFIVYMLIRALRPANKTDMFAVLPIATFNTAVLGPLLIMAGQNFGFVQTMGFSLGSGLGYAFVVVIVTEGERKMNNRNVPAAFRGLPIKLIYIGILALAIYGLTGHRVAI